MTTLKVAAVRREVETLIKQYEGRRVNLKEKNLSRGKLYELYVLGCTLKELAGRKFSVSLAGKVLDLKQAPGVIDPDDAHFVATANATGDKYRICTDIEVRTLGSEISSSSGLCSYHEIDIVVVDYDVTGRPPYSRIALGVECKSHAKFRKGIVKEALGVKREISYYSARKAVSKLAQSSHTLVPLVPSDPPLEYWLVFCDPAGLKYWESPGAFGITFKNWRP